MSCIVINAPLWSFMDLHGSLWTHTVLYAHTCSITDFYGPTGPSMVRYDLEKYHMVFNRPLWSYMILYDHDKSDMSTEKCQEE